MNADFIIRSCQVDDLPALIKIWEESRITLGPSDTVPELMRLLTRNPSTCLVCDLTGQVVGGVMGGFDGRRGLVHHLAVTAEHRGEGLGKALMAELDRRFRELGLEKYSFWIEADNTEVIKFYQHLGYELRDLITMSKTLRKQ